MSGQPDLAAADEALQAMIVRFKAEPSSGVFVDLSEALLARGHGNEALQVAEFGLQHQPASVEGRVQRASALLALGRPRVAYVELLRALAVEPHHHRGMRLLGRVFVEAGAPERAAKLLARRLGNRPAMPSPRVEAEPEPVEPRREPPPPDRPVHEPTQRIAVRKPADGAQRPPPLPTPPRDPTPLPPGTLGAGAPLASSPVSELFRALTEDLGLLAMTPASPVNSRVEITQVPRGRRTASAGEGTLSSIEGPIVDRGDDTADDLLDTPSSAGPPSTLFDVVSSAQFRLDGDEPLFNDAFEVRPVEGQATADLFPEEPNTPPPVEAAPLPPVGPGVPPPVEPSLTIARRPYQRGWTLGAIVFLLVVLGAGWWAARRDLAVWFGPTKAASARR